MLGLGLAAVLYSVPLRFGGEVYVDRRGRLVYVDSAQGGRFTPGTTYAISMDHRGRYVSRVVLRQGHRLNQFGEPYQAPPQVVDEAAGVRLVRHSQRVTIERAGFSFEIPRSSQGAARLDPDRGLVHVLGTEDGRLDLQTRSLDGTAVHLERWVRTEDGRPVGFDGLHLSLAVLRNGRVALVGEPLPRPPGPSRPVHLYVVDPATCVARPAYTLELPALGRGFYPLLTRALATFGRRTDVFLRLDHRAVRIRLVDE